MADRQPVPDDPTPEEEERFWGQVRGLEKGACEEWIGTMFAHGYGLYWYRGKIRRAHRVAYVWQYGEPDTDLDHRCNNKRCVRAHPDHVWPLSRRENVLRGEGPTAINARKTKPDCGHDERFTYVDPRGWRGCTECRRAAVARHRAKSRDTINAKRRTTRVHVVYPEQPCQHCSKPFTPQRSDGRYCLRRDCINSRQRENRRRRLAGGDA